MSTPQAAIPEFTSSVPGPQQERRFGDAYAEDGDLLSLPEPQAAARAMKLFQSQNPIMQPLIEQWKINEHLRRGITGSKLIQDPVTGQWRARPPTRVTVNAEFVNKAAALCRKFTGVLTADPPAPEAVPGEGDGDDPSSAEFATRGLVHVDSELAREKKLTRAVDQAHTCATTFERFFYNPTGNGRVPVEVEAGYDPDTGEEAQSVFDAEFQVVTDPLTGAPMGQRPWRKRRQRFVREDGTLTENKAEAATRWEGRTESEILRANNVRLYPHTAEDIDDAHGAGVLCFVAWGKLRTLFPEKLVQVPKESKDRIFNWRPDWTEAALPSGVDRRQLEKSRAEGNEDEYLVPVLTTYFDGKKCPGEYPRGVYMVQIADFYVLHRETWEYDDQDGMKQPRMIPLSQMTLFREGRPHWAGVALMEIVGPGNEIRAAQIGSLLEYLDRLASVKTLVPTSSITNPLEYADRTKRYIAFNPEGGVPTVEQLPPYPAAATEMFNMMTGELNDLSMLQETGQGLEASSVESGVQAMTVLAQVQAALSPQARAVVDFFLRGSRIELEMIRAHYTRPRRVRWVGEDGRHKERAWTRADLGSTTDVELKAGSMTMLRPAQKAMLAREYFQMGLLPPTEFQLAAERGVGGTLALRDNPFRQRIRRQIEDWKAGPPEGWVPPNPVMEPVLEPVLDPATGQPAVDEMGQPMAEPVLDPATGGPAMQQTIDPMTGQPAFEPDPAAMQIWAPVPSDTLPHVAQLRLTEIARLTATVTYERMHPGWRLGVDAEFQRMLGVVQMMAQPMPDPGAPQDDSAPSPPPAQPAPPTPFQAPGASPFPQVAA